MKTNARKFLEATIAASAFAFAGSVAAQAAQDEPAPSQPYQVTLNEPRPVVVEPTQTTPLFRDRWDIPYKDLVFERELSRTDGSFQGDPLNPLVSTSPTRYPRYSRY
jgi:GAF domain-containing protein